MFPHIIPRPGIDLNNIFQCRHFIVFVFIQSTLYRAGISVNLIFLFTKNSTPASFAPFNTIGYDPPDFITSYVIFKHSNFSKSGCSNVRFFSCLKSILGKSETTLCRKSYSILNGYFHIRNPKLRFYRGV